MDKLQHRLFNKMVTYPTDHGQYNPGLMLEQKERERFLIRGLIPGL